MGVNLLLVDLGSPRNIGRIIRSAYVLAGKSSNLFIFDPRKRLENEIMDVRASSVTLVDKTGSYSIVNDIGGFLANYKSDYGGRIVETEVSSGAIPLPCFKFEENDLILLGNENRGYRDKHLKEYPGINLAGSKLMIPMLGEIFELPDKGKVVPPDHGTVPNLNVSVSAEIILYAALNHLGYFEGKDFSSLSNRNNSPG